MQETSILANKAANLEMRSDHWDKIIKALNELGEAVYEKIADHCGLEKHQVGRRLDELVKQRRIYNTLKTGLTSTGRKANMYAIRKPDTIIPEPESYKPTDTSAADIACSIIAKTGKGKLEQQKLFES